LKQKLLVFLNDFNRGGAEWVITNLCNELVKKNCSVRLISVKNGEMFEELNPRLIAGHYNGNLIHAYLILYKLLCRNKYNILLTTQRPTSIITYILHKLSFSRTKLVIREAASNFKSSYDDKGRIKKFFLKTLYKLSYGNAYSIIVNSEATKNDLVNEGIIKSSKVNVFHIDNPVDIDLIRQRSIEVSPIPTSHSIKTVVTIARLVKHKNIENLIQAFEKVVYFKPTTQLIIIGDGPERQKLSELAEDLNIQNNVHFTGRLSNPYPVLHNSDLFVLPSKWEGFGMVVVEALTLGVPVIASNIDGGPRHILENGEYGILVKPDSVADLAESIILNLGKDHDKEKFKRRAGEFNKSVIVEKYITAIFGDRL